MMERRTRSRASGLTLIELLVVVALVAVAVALAAPSFRELIEMQRLRSVAAQVVTDVQFARSEAAARQRPSFIAFGPAQGMSCYVIYTCANGSECCTCTQNGTFCEPGSVAIRTVQVPASSGVRVKLTAAGEATPTHFSFDPATGGMTALSSSALVGVEPLLGPVWIDTSLTRDNPPVLRTRVEISGRPQLCSAAGSVSGISGC